jgi:hypothetical protein
VKGGFFLEKKPLEYVLSVYTISENAIDALTYSARSKRWEWRTVTHFEDWPNWSPQIPRKRHIAQVITMGNPRIAFD